MTGWRAPTSAHLVEIPYQDEGEPQEGLVGSLGHWLEPCLGGQSGSSQQGSRHAHTSRPAVGKAAR